MPLEYLENYWAVSPSGAIFTNLFLEYTCHSHVNVCKGRRCVIIIIIIIIIIAKIIINNA
jgi:hypothetical protein